MNIALSVIRAVLVGGLVCLIAQVLIDKTGLSPARILVGYVVLGVVLGGLGIFEALSSFAGAGVTVPILGFGNVLSEGVRSEVDARGLIGAFTGGISAAAGGITASLVFGLLAALIFRSGRK